MKVELGDRLAVGALVLAAGLTAAVYDRLPAVIPVHFDLHGRPDGWMPREIGAWSVLAVGAIVWLVTRFAVLALAGRDRENLDASPVATVAAILMGMVCGVQLALVHAALYEPHRVGLGLAFVLAATWVAIGLVMPRMRRNRWMGVRTPWTLASDENWSRAHRVAGYAFAVGGVLAFGAFAAGQPLVAGACLVLSGAAPIVHSYRLSRGA